MNYFSEIFNAIVPIIIDKIPFLILYASEHSLWQRLIQSFYKKTMITINALDTTKGSKVVTDGYNYTWKPVGTYENVFEWHWKQKNYYNCITGRFEIRTECVYEPVFRFVTKNQYVSEPNYKGVETHHGIISDESNKFTIYIFEDSQQDALNYMNKNFPVGSTIISHKFCSMINLAKGCDRKTHFIGQHDDPDFNKGFFVIPCICVGAFIVGYKIVKWLCY
jgi:hypothetical protein